MSEAQKDYERGVEAMRRTVVKLLEDHGGVITVGAAVTTGIESEMITAVASYLREIVTLIQDLEPERPATPPDPLPIPAFFPRPEQETQT